MAFRGLELRIITIPASPPRGRGNDAKMFGACMTLTNIGHTWSMHLGSFKSVIIPFFIIGIST